MSRQKAPRNNDMNTTVFLLLFCTLTAHCATHGTQDKNLSRMIRSPHFTKSASGDSSIVFRTQNWSGVASDANGAQGVFSGAAAAAGNTAPAADEAFSIAASGDAPVKDKLEERFGGSDDSDLHYITFNPPYPNFYNPYIPDHRGNGQWGHGGYNNYYRGLIGHPRGGYNYGQLNTGAHSQAFAKSEASSNAASGCDDMTQNDLSGNGQQNTNTLTKSQAFSNAGSGFGDTTQNSGQFSSNTFKNQEKTFSVPNGRSNGGYGSGSYNSQSQLQPALNAGSNGNLQTTAESKTFNLKSQSESFSSGIQQSKSFGNGFSNFKGSEYNGGQQVHAQGTGFGSSQDLQKGSGQEVESQGDVFGSSQGLLNGGSQQVASHGNEFGSSQGLQNGGGQQVKSYDNGFSNTQGFHNAGKDKAKYQSSSNGFGSDESKKASSEIGNGYGSQLAKGFQLGTGSDNGNVQTNYNRQETSSLSGSKTFDGGFTGHGQNNAYGRGSGSSKYQSEGTSRGVETGGFTGQASDSDGILTNNANSNGQQSLTSSSAASGHEGLQNGGGQQVEFYDNGFSNTQGFHNAGKDKAKYQSSSNGFGSDESKKASSEIGNGYGSQLAKGFQLGTGSDNGNVQTNYNRQDTSSLSGSKTFDGGFTGHGQNNAYGRGSGSSKYQSEGTSRGVETGGFTGQASDSDGILTNNANSNGQQSLTSSSAASGHEDLQSTLSGALGLASQGLQASQNQPCSTCQKSSYAFSNAKSYSGSAVALSIGG